MRVTTRSRFQAARLPHRRVQSRGATAVELALVLSLLISLVLGVVDLARWTLAAEGLHEGARLGARLAAVCDVQDPVVSDRVRQRLTTLSGVDDGTTSAMSGVMPTILLNYEPSGCNTASCTAVRVTLQGAAMPGVAPWWTGPLALPTAMVEVPRESLRSTVGGRVNAQCL